MEENARLSCNVFRRLKFTFVVCVFIQGSIKFQEIIIFWKMKVGGGGGGLE